MSIELEQYMEKEGIKFVKEGRNIKVCTSLDLTKNTNIASLDYDEMFVSGEFIATKHIKVFPKLLLSTSGDCIIEGTAKTEFPKAIRAFRDFILKGRSDTFSQIESLKASRNVDLRNKKGVKKLPTVFDCGGILYIGGSGIKEIPDTSAVKGHIDYTKYLKPSLRRRLAICDYDYSFSDDI